MKPFVIFTAALIAFDLLASAGSAAESSRDDAPAIKQFLRGYLRKQVDTPDPSVRVAIAHADLKGNGQRDAVVYLSGGGSCGSGGCTTVVIVPKGQSYKVVMYEPITILPIKLLRTSTNGWRDISVVRKGDLRGDHFEYPEIVRSFKDSRYRDNLAANRNRRGTSGSRILIAPTDSGTPLYE